MGALGPERNPKGEEGEEVGRGNKNGKEKAAVHADQGGTFLRGGCPVLW